MGREIEHSKRPEPLAISPLSRPRSEGKEIGEMLMVLAEARQAPIKAETLKLFGEELSCYSMEDIAATIHKLMFHRREEGETAFPDLPTLDYEIRQAKNVRLKALREAEEKKRYEDEQGDIQEHPERYFNVGDMIHEQLSKRPKPEPRKAAGVIGDLTALSAADLRKLAGVIERSKGRLSGFSPDELRARADRMESNANGTV